MAPRILIVSEDLVEPWDEGIKKFTVSVAGALAGDHDVTVINVDRGGFAAARNGSRSNAGTLAIRSVTRLAAMRTRPKGTIIASPL